MNAKARNEAKAAVTIDTPKPVGDAAQEVVPPVAVKSKFAVNMTAMLLLPLEERGIDEKRQTAIAVEIQCAVDRMGLGLADFAIDSDDHRKELTARKTADNVQRGIALCQAWQSEAFAHVWEGADWQPYMQGKEKAVVGKRAVFGGGEYRVFNEGGKVQFVYGSQYRNLWQAWFNLAFKNPADAFTLLKRSPAEIGKELTRLKNLAALATAGKANKGAGKKAGKVKDVAVDGTSDDGTIVLPEMPASMLPVVNMAGSLQRILIENADALAPEVDFLESLTDELRKIIQAIGKMVSTDDTGEED